MANITFNVAKGRDVELVRNVKNNTPANSGLLVVLLQTVEADTTLRRRETLAAVLSSNTVCNFTNYEHKILNDVDITLPTPNHTSDNQSWSIPAVQWTSGGGAVNNSIVKTIICYCPDVTNIVTANCIPLTAHDANQTTDGNNVDLPGGVANTSA
jgi:hypothetical protein